MTNHRLYQEYELISFFEDNRPSGIIVTRTGDARYSELSFSVCARPDQISPSTCARLLNWIAACLLLRTFTGPVGQVFLSYLFPYAYMQQQRGRSWCCVCSPIPPVDQYNYPRWPVIPRNVGLLRIVHWNLTGIQVESNST